VELVGLHAAAAQAAEKLFGVGYAQYRYAPLADLKVTRTISVLPSNKAGDGTSAFLVSVRMENTGTEATEAAYSENVDAEYAQIFAEWDADRELVSYSSQTVRFGCERAQGYRRQCSKPCWQVIPEIFLIRKPIELSVGPTAICGERCFALPGFKS
jgi:hypothetical protein